MKDINGVEMKTGDIVEIKNAYFKVDNGLYFVENVPGNVTWCGSYLSLHKITKKGELSIAKYSTGSWPLFICTNNREKNAAAREWNKDHATIEVIEGIATEHIQAHFEEEAESTQKQADYQKWNFGEESEYYKKVLEMVAHYRNVVKYIKSKEAQPEAIEEVEAIEETIELETIEAEHKTTEQKKPLSIERKYFPINETLARQSLEMWSFSDYKPNSTTNSYRAEVNRVYEIVEHIQEQKPHRLEEAEVIAEKYSRKYAEWINKSNHIEMMCPSVMICGAGNFPVRKKEKQNRARDNHQKEYNYINGYIAKLENILNGQEIIKSNVQDAIEKLQEKVEQLEKLQNIMKDANAYYKKNNTLDGFEMDEKIKSNCYRMIKSGWSNRPFPAYELTNNNAKINNTKDRLEQLKKAKSIPTKEAIENDICQVIENTEAMRIQLVFDAKPDEKTRDILKSNGFKWAPSQGAWQRQLTDNARYSTKQVLKQLQQLQTA